MKLLRVLMSAFVLSLAACSDAASSSADPSILVFTKTAGFRHASIPDGVSALRSMSAEQGWMMEHTEDASLFTPETLTRFDVIVFLNTTGDVLDDGQMAALRGRLRAGGGIVGIHSATDTEADDPWYPKMMGARFASHPAIQPAVINVSQTAQHPAIAHLPARWMRTDEWYDFREPPASGIHVLLDLDGSSYQGSRTQGVHPIAWYQEFEGGRVFYTGLGHTPESYREPEFLTHLREAIRWAGQLAQQ